MCSVISRRDLSYIFTLQKANQSSFSESRVVIEVYELIKYRARVHAAAGLNGCNISGEVNSYDQSLLQAQVSTRKVIHLVSPTSNIAKRLERAFCGVSYTRTKAVLKRRFQAIHDPALSLSLSLCSSLPPTMIAKFELYLQPPSQYIQNPKVRNDTNLAL